MSFEMSSPPTQTGSCCDFDVVTVIRTEGCPPCSGIHWFSTAKDQCWPQPAASEFCCQLGLLSHTSLIPSSNFISYSHAHLMSLVIRLKNVNLVIVSDWKQKSPFNSQGNEF